MSTRPWPEYAYPTAEQFADWYPTATREERVAIAATLLEASERAHRCAMQDHDNIVREQNLRIFRHEAETPPRSHDADGRCCLLAALGQEGAQEPQNRDLTASGPESGQGDHRDDEGRSGARDGLTCLAAVPPGWPHVPCVRPFKHKGEHSATPKWVDLFGIDPDYTGGQDVNDWLDESRGDA